MISRLVFFDFFFIILECFRVVGRMKEKLPFSKSKKKGKEKKGQEKKSFSFDRLVKKDEKVINEN